MECSSTLRLLIIVLLLERGLSLLNLAVNGTATQSGDFEEFGVTYVASKAIDGNKDQSFTGRSCGHTPHGNTAAWWKLDIGYVANIHRVVVYYRNDLTETRRLDGFYLYVSNSSIVKSGHQCFHDPQDGKLTNTFQNITCNTVGQYVVFYNERKNPSEAFVELCEVEVFGCILGRYGTDCGSSCSGNCKDGYCDVQTGTCICKPGYEGAKCTETCGMFLFGPNCANSCNCLNRTTCNNINGRCNVGSCDPGWKGDSCSTRCPQGPFGNDCINRCEGCVDEECDVENGKCLKGGCKPGHHGERCLVLGYSDHGGVSYAVYAGTIVGIIVVMAIAIIVWQSWSTRKRGKQKVYEDIHTNIDQENRPGNAEETYTELTTDEAYAEVHV